jgi:hypothetical protein
MASPTLPPGGSPGNPAIVEIEAVGIGIRADLALNAIEFWVTDQTGAGFRTWIGADRAAHVALQFAIAAADLWRRP